MLCSRAAEDVERDEGDDDGQRSVDRACHGLIDALAYYDIKTFAGTGMGEILADAVEDNDSVVDGKTQDDEQSRDE